MLLVQGPTPGASAAETYQNLRRERSERFPRLARFAVCPGTVSPFPRLPWVDFAFLPALVLRAIVRSASSERANQAAPSCAPLDSSRLPLLHRGPTAGAATASLDRRLRLIGELPDLRCAGLSGHDQLRFWVVVLYAGGTSSSDELPNEGNESDHEQEMNQPTAHVEDDEAE